jgi:hypothetical protein
MYSYVMLIVFEKIISSSINGFYRTVFIVFQFYHFHTP